MLMERGNLRNMLAGIVVLRYLIKGSRLSRNTFRSAEWILIFPAMRKLSARFLTGILSIEIFGIDKSKRSVCLPSFWANSNFPSRGLMERLSAWIVFRSLSTRRVFIRIVYFLLEDISIRSDRLTLMLPVS